MRYVFLVLTLIALCFIAGAQPYPLKAEEVVGTFYKTYDFDGLPTPKIQWEKRNHSWYVYSLEPDSGLAVHLNRQLFYDATKGEYETLGFEKRKSGVVSKDINSLMNGEAYNFDVQPSYGYTGWHKDVIEKYRSKADLTIDETYSLARAYSSAASACLSNQFGNALPGEVFTTALRTNCLTETQVDTYLAFETKSIALFEKIAILNPAFETLVGSIVRKAANERVMAFHNVMVYAGNFLGKVQLPENLYEKDLLDSIKRLLAACPQGSVFLSFDDNDFYPILYLQAKGFRQDVHLINVSLMALDRYIFYGTAQTWFRAKPIASSFDTAQYKGEKNSYRYMNSGKSLPMTMIVDAIKKLPEGKNLPSGKWVIAGKKVKGVVQKNTVAISSAYVFKDTMILMDALNRLNGRKFCTLSFFGDQLSNLNPFFRQKNGLLIYDN